MEWFYAEGDRQCGPVSDEQLVDLARSGKVLPNSLVWRQGMAHWQSYASAQSGTPLAGSSPMTATGTAQCAECGHTFSVNDMVSFRNSWVCAACKPIFLQRMQEGAPPPVSMALWRSGKILVTAPRAAFPDRCVKCNAPANGARLKRTLYWYPPYVIVLILLSLLIGLIIAMVVRKMARVEIGLCEVHRSRRVRSIALGWVLGLGGFVLFVAGIINSWGFVTLLCFAAFVCGMVFLARSNVINAKRIDSNHVWIKGVCQPFLDMLPEWKE